MHMVNNTLVVDMVVYDMQVWCGYFLFEVPMKFMTLGTVFALVYVDMNNFLLP